MCSARVIGRSSDLPGVRHKGYWSGAIVWAKNDSRVIYEPNIAGSTSSKELAIQITLQLNHAGIYCWIKVVGEGVDRTPLLLQASALPKALSGTLRTSD